MSLNSITERDVKARRQRERPSVVFTVPAAMANTVEQVLTVNGTPVVPPGGVGRTPPPPAATATRENDTKADNTAVGEALKTLTNYIPGEVILLYTAVASAKDQLQPLAGTMDLKAATFWGGVALTVVLVWVFTALKGSEKNLDGAWVPTWFTWWNLAAGAVAFMVWANALPYFKEATAVDGLLAVAVTVVLGAVGKAVERWDAAR